MSLTTTSRRRVAGVAWLALAGTVLAGCASKGDVQFVHDEMRRLAARQDTTLRVLIDAVERGDRATRDSLLAVSEFLFDWRGDVASRLSGVQDQQRRLAEYVGQNQRSLAAVREELIAQRRRLDERLAAAGGDEAAAAVAQSEEAAPPPGDGDAAGQAFDAARRQFNLGNMGVARRAFEAFLDRFPNSSLAPGAHIHLGELLSLEERFPEAIEAYLEVPERFPTAGQVPDALYRASLVHRETEDFDAERELLERLVGTYPEHRHAESARERLEEIS